MKIVVEAVTAEYGGIRTYVEQLLAAWVECEPDDVVHVLVAEGSTLALPASVVRHTVAVRGPAALGRPWAQTRGLRALVRRTHPDAVLATLPSTTLLSPGVPMGLVVYDLRHELRPEQFSPRTRLLRRVSYGRGYALADVMLCISQRTLDDLRERHPRLRRTPALVAHLGSDHALAWPSPASDSGPAIAFGHHSNKNPDLVLDAWALAASRGVALPPLSVLGLGSARRATFESLIAERGLTGRVTPAPFLEEPAFQAAFGSSALVVFPSDFEGFGLPVVEAMTLGIPVVIGPERATQEVAGGHAFVAASWTPSSLADAIAAALAATPSQLAAAQAHARAMTWARTVQVTRSALLGLVHAFSGQG